MSACYIYVAGRLLILLGDHTLTWVQIAPLGFDSRFLPGLLSVSIATCSSWEMARVFSHDPQCSKAQRTSVLLGLTLWMSLHGKGTGSVLMNYSMRDHWLFLSLAEKHILVQNKVYPSFIQQHLGLGINQLMVKRTYMLPLRPEGFFAVILWSNANCSKF